MLPQKLRSSLALLCLLPLSACGRSAGGTEQRPSELLPNGPDAGRSSASNPASAEHPRRPHLASMGMRPAPSNIPRVPTRPTPPPSTDAGAPHEPSLTPNVDGGSDPKADGGVGDAGGSIDSGTRECPSTSILLKPGPEEGKDATLHLGLESLFPVVPYNDLHHRNDGNHFGLEATAWTREGGEVETVTRALLEFELPPIPAGYRLASAELKLFASRQGPTKNASGGHNPHSGDNSAILFRVAGPWEEDTVTWDNWPGAYLGGKVLHNSFPQFFRDYTVELTDWAHEWYAGTVENNGLMIAQWANVSEFHPEFYCALPPLGCGLLIPKKYNSMFFASSDNDFPEHFPELLLTYEAEDCAER